MDKDSFLKWLYDLQVHGIKLGLSNITGLLNKLGDPQNSFKTIHVAGTDGKGSTSACIYSILRASGVMVGLYTSPHLIEFNERIVFDGTEITNDELAELASEIVPIVGSMEESGAKCTFFEVTTAIAFMHFRNKGAEYAVIEVGMGGRFDATNIIIPEVCVIGNISLEHTEFLGDTIEKIAFEKAGIIKPGVPCITLNEDHAYDVIKEVAFAKGAPLTRVLPEDIEIRNNGVRCLSFTYKGEEYDVSVPGRHQANNASMAIEAVSKLKIFGQCIRCNVRKGLKSVYWPCRMEKMKGLPIILDVTHTHAGSAELAVDISEIYGKVLVIFGVLNDKDIVHICRDLSTIATRMIVTQPDSVRAESVADVNRIMSEYETDITMTKNVQDAIEEAFRSRKKDELILVTGSFYMAGDALKWLKKTYARF